MTLLINLGIKKSSNSSSRDGNREAQTSGVVVISPVMVAMPRISMKRIQYLYPVVLRDGVHVARPSTRNDKKSNIKVALLDACSGQMLADLLFISLVKQRGKQVSMKA